MVTVGVVVFWLDFVIGLTTADNGTIDELLSHEIAVSI